MIGKFALSLILVGLIVLGGVVVPVAGVSIDTDPITSDLPDRPLVSQSTPRPTVPPPPRPVTATPVPVPIPSGSVIYGRDWDVCLDAPASGVQVYIVARALEGATPFGDFQAFLLQVTSPELGFLRVFSAPDSLASEVATVAHGAFLTLLDSPAEALAKIGQQDAWIRVRTADGAEGYVAAWGTYYEGIVTGVAPTYVVDIDPESNYGITGLPAGQYTIWLSLPGGFTPLQPPLVVTLRENEVVRVDLNYCGMIPIMPETGQIEAPEASPTAPSVGLLLGIGSVCLALWVLRLLLRRQQS